MKAASMCLAACLSGLLIAGCSIGKPEGETWELVSTATDPDSLEIQSPRNKTREKKKTKPTTTLQGIAANEKLGAAVQADGRTIVLEGVNAWPEDMVGQGVSVTGSLLIKDFGPADMVNPSQRGSGKVVFIEQAKWSRIEPASDSLPQP